MGQCAAELAYHRTGALFPIRRRCPRQAAVWAEDDKYVCAVHARMIAEGRGVVWHRIEGMDELSICENTINDIPEDRLARMGNALELIAEECEVRASGPGRPWHVWSTLAQIARDGLQGEPLPSVSRVTNRGQEIGGKVEPRGTRFK